MVALSTTVAPKAKFFTTLGLLPPHYFTCFWIAKVLLQSTLILLVFCCAALYQTHRHTKQFNLALVANIATQVLMGLTAVGCVSFSYFRRDSYEVVLEELEAPKDDNLKDKKFQRNAVVSFAFMQLIAALYFSIYLFWMLKQEAAQDLTSKVLSFVSEIVLMYHILMIFYLTALMLWVCKQKYLELNEMITRISNLKIFDDQKLLKEIKDFKEIYKKLNKVCENLNQAFAPQLTLMPLICLVRLLELGLFIKHIWINDSGQLLSGIAKMSFGVLFIIATSIITILCDQIVAHSKRTMTVSYELQDYISIFSAPYQELQLFTNRIPLTKVNFSAMGLFESKRSLLLTILGSAATNFIVAEQFWKPDS